MLKKQLREFKINPEQVGKRTDIYVAEQLPEYTRASLRNLFDGDYVCVNKKTVKPAYILKTGDKLTIDLSVFAAQPQMIDLPIVYEDDDVIVINKPAGILTHSKGAINNEATVASFIKPLLTDKNLVGNRAGIVHRLDRATSGVIIAAKNHKALKWLQKQFSTRKTNKIYLAVVEGVPTPQEAIIDAPIERNPKKPQTFRVGGSGRPSQTRYKVLKTSTLGGSSNSYSLLELIPQTGRTHQLRVHLKYVAHPIIGDRVYGHDGEKMYLHAKSLEITLPNGQRKKFDVPEPNIFNKFTK